MYFQKKRCIAMLLAGGQGSRLKVLIRFFVDGVQYAEQWETKIDNNDSWPFNKPHFIILNLAIGGTMGGSVDDAIFNVPRIMYVDYVRVYQRTEK